MRALIVERLRETRLTSGRTDLGADAATTAAMGFFDFFYDILASLGHPDLARHRGPETREDWC